MVSAAYSKSLLSQAEGEKVADRPDEGVIRRFCRLEILNGVPEFPHRKVDSREVHTEG